MSPLWASLCVGVNQDGIAVLLSPSCFTNPLQCGPDVGVLCRCAGSLGDMGCLQKFLPPRLPAQSVWPMPQLLSTSLNSVAAFLFFLQGPPGLPGPPGPPGPPGAVVNIKGVSQDGAGGGFPGDPAVDTRLASAGTSQDFLMASTLVFSSHRLFFQYLPGHTAKPQ